MTSQTDHPISRRSALAGLGAGGLGVALAATVRPASAQDATPVSLAGHPLTGAWFVNIPGPPNPPGPAQYSFTSDGIVTQLDPVRGNAMGAWVAMGERTGVLTLVFVNYAPGSTTDFQGFAVVRQMLEVDATGDAYAGQSEIEFRAPDGTTRTDGPYGPIQIDGKRIQVETTLVTVTVPAMPAT